MYAQARSFRQHRESKDVASLTPREKEVIRLSSEGLTSHEIAARLGMSARTANQHIDNVADKLGTRNRAHTVAEVIRHNLLN
jgi:DNA-binding CsgD family transcriptional regulator